MALWQASACYVTCRIYLVNAVNSVNVVLGFSPNKRYILFKLRFRQHFVPATESLHGARSIPCNVHVGGPSEKWRYRRSEMRPSHSDSKYGHEEKEENVWKGGECLFYCGKRMSVMICATMISWIGWHECSCHLSIYCASFLTKSTIYVVHFKILTTSCF